jgi:hypothetical protein
MHFRFCGRHIGFSGGGRVAKDKSFCSLNIFRESQGRVSVNSKRFENGVQKSGLGGDTFINLKKRHGTRPVFPYGNIHISHVTYVKKKKFPVIEASTSATYPNGIKLFTLFLCLGGLRLSY